MFRLLLDIAVRKSGRHIIRLVGDRRQVPLLEQVSYLAERVRTWEGERAAIAVPENSKLPLHDKSLRNAERQLMRHKSELATAIHRCRKAEVPDWLIRLASR